MWGMLQEMIKQKIEELEKTLLNDAYRLSQRLHENDVDGRQTLVIYSKIAEECIENMTATYMKLKNLERIDC